jgi:beta-barrel assembly-enhancing protease
MQARYADGRHAVTQDVECDIGADALTIRVAGSTHVWPYSELARGDDGNGRIVLKRKPDSGERVVFEAEAEGALKLAAPKLFTPRAQGVEGLSVLGSVVIAAWSLAGAFLIGIPFMARPIAEIMPPLYRDQVADVSWSQVNAMTQYCEDSDQAAAILNAMAYRIMEASDVRQREDIWISIVDAPFPNAFALPDNSIIVTDDLIALAESPDEVAGVIAHEIAHIEHNHVMSGVVRQMGAGIFFDIVFGGAGAGQAIAIASVNLAGLRYTRGDEEDADARGLEYLDAAGVDAGGLARMFQRLEEMQREAGLSEIPAILSTHPASDARAATARARSRQGLTPSISDADWQVVRRACGASPEPAAETPAPARPGPPESLERPTPSGQGATPQAAPPPAAPAADKPL